MKIKRIISSLFVIVALIVLLIGRVLPHHHHVTYIAENITPITVICLGTHCHDTATCNHTDCTHHNHEGSVCLDSEKILFEQHNEHCKIVHGMQSPLLLALPQYDLPVVEQTCCRKLQVYIYPKIPDDTFFSSGLRAPPFYLFGQSVA